MSRAHFSTEHVRGHPCGPGCSRTVREAWLNASRTAGCETSCSSAHGTRGVLPQSQRARRPSTPRAPARLEACSVVLRLGLATLVLLASAVPRPLADLAARALVSGLAPSCCGSLATLLSGTRLP